MNKTFETIHDYIFENRDNITEMLIKLAKIPSVSTEAVRGSMFGENCGKIMLELEELFVKADMDAFTEIESAYILGVTEGDEKTLGIFCHADVVSAVEEDWIYTKPFEPIVKDGFLIGRGVDDNKSGIVSAIWAMKALRHANLLPKSTVVIYVGGNEECGMSDLELFNRSNPSPDFSLVPDNEYPVCRGEKGIMRFWARFRTPFKNILSINGGQSLNIVLGSVNCEMKYSDLLRGQLEKFCRGKSEYILTVGDTLTLTAKGKSTHAAYPDSSVNALYVLIQALKNCDALGDDIKILTEAEKLVADPYSETVGMGTEDTEFKKTTCTNGIAKTVDGKLNISFDTRYGTEIDIETFIEGYKRILDGMNADTDVTERDDGYIIPENTPIIKQMTDAWQSITGNNDKSYLSYGGTYARHLKNAVSIGTCIATTEPIPMPDGHGGAHQPDEAIDIEGLLKSIEVITHMILKADETLHA